MTIASTDGLVAELKKAGYTANPAGIIQIFDSDFTVRGDLAWFDINADAVRIGTITPDRPIRVTYERVGGAWQATSVRELKPGETSMALDRQPETPRMAPWKTITWDAFPQKLAALREEYKASPSPLLFRGQGNSKWDLTTTLERSGFPGMLFGDYYHLISKIGAEIKSFTGLEVPERDSDVVKSFQNQELLTLPGFPPVPLYQYMIYLRHHGFPSPLLDWSRSPFVAAFFAFRDTHADVETRSIYAYCEMPHGTKGGAVGGPTIKAIGPYVPGDRRHFRQQSDYTICGRFDTTSNGWRFEPHQTVFEARRPNQDVLWRFDFASSEREKVLSMLDEYNLNGFSLFDSDETLLEMLWLREFAFRQR